MGVASYREDIFFRFLEQTEGPPEFSGETRNVLTCPFCDTVFFDRAPLFEHLAVAHRGERPFLLIAGREPSFHTMVRHAFKPAEVMLQNCTSVNFRIDGMTRTVSIKEAPDLLAARSSSIVEIELRNKFDSRAEPIVTRYRLRYSVPTKTILDNVDRAFRHHLAKLNPKMEDIRAFLDDALIAEGGRDYAGALAEYVMGVLIADRTAGTTLGISEASGKYGAALDALSDVRRPLASVICAIIRFTKNDFSNASRTTLFDRLDRCNSILGPAAGKGSPEVSSTDERSKSNLITLCPIDQSTDLLLTFGSHMAQQGRWGPTLAAECEKTANGEHLDQASRIKALAIWAATAMRTGASFEALTPLRQLRNLYPFESWAANNLDRIES